jgi:hypothetical protein
MGGVVQSDIDRGNSRNGPAHEILVSDDRISGDFQPADAPQASQGILLELAGIDVTQDLTQFPMGDVTTRRGAESIVNEGLDNIELMPIGMSNDDFCLPLNRKRAEVGFARETRRSNLRRISQAKREGVRRTWIPTASLITAFGGPPRRPG